MKDIGHFIDGRRVAGTSGQHGPIFNPATGEQTGRVAFAGAAEVDAAVQAAMRAQPAWAATGLLRRMRVMFKLKELLDQNLDRLARLVTDEHGKVHDDAKGSVIRGWRWSSSPAACRR
jgi:malonate-semialdehyde dehydrogenase (acetylating)/methylmalonate-semialdehyde dehydrogenase